MPEYLAPGVYVEETSFRAKSIEGVGTSTTGFVGLTRKGPISGTLELITSFGDFERIYGGLTNLALGTLDAPDPKNLNYLAHAVRAYFDNGGSRLYISRVYSPLPNGVDPNDAEAKKKVGCAVSVFVVDSTDAKERARFIARTPGRAGNGRIGIRLVESPATVRSMESAPRGSMLRFLDNPGNVPQAKQLPAAPAQLVGGIPPFSLPAQSELKLTVDETKKSIPNTSAEAIGKVALVGPNIDLPDNDASQHALSVTIDDNPEKVIPLTDPVVLANLVSDLNAALGTSGTARLTLPADPVGAGHLAIKSNKTGDGSKVSVKANPALGFTEDTSAETALDETQKTIPLVAKAEATSSSKLDDAMDLPDGVTPADAALNTLRITIDGGQEQIINLPTAPASTPQNMVDKINLDLKGGSARLTTNADTGQAGRLAISSSRKGLGGSVKVKANPSLKFLSDTTSEININDPSNVTADDINAALRKAGVDATAALSTENNRLVITSSESSGRAGLRVESSSGAAYLGLPVGGSLVKGTTGLKARYFNKDGANWKENDNAGTPLNLAGLKPTEQPGVNASFLTMLIVTEDGDGNQIMYEDVGFHAEHPRYIGNVLAWKPTRRTEALENMFAVEIGTGVDAFELLNGIFAGGTQRIVTLSGGSDGGEPIPEDYTEPLAELTKVEDIAIVAAPGHSVFDEEAYQGIQNALITHAEKRRSYRIAVLDTPPNNSTSEARDVRSRIDSKYAALYYPWVVIPNPLARPGLEHIPREIAVPPSGFVCGIYARNDTQRGVFKAPANEVVLGALRFESDVNFAQQEMLNPLGINCLRFFPGRGYRVWGARTASSDPEWKYVNIRRYFNYLERSIDVSTQWAVFEPNGERLWANIRETVSDFLYNEWVSGALLGSSTKEAFFVRCDRSTMTQNDLDNGRLICLIGVAAIKPAEFVIFRIGQKTADARS
ncbi:MAG: uncharacterized protein QOH63_2941 [Acidobacteriota bacterium]|nr:uncharacterized protein [Acidobacteriota bacterium]